MLSILLDYQIEHRLKAYPIKYLKIGYYLERQPIVLEIYKFTENFFQYLDLNYYFFANHPNSRVGIAEVEKFPYILLPFFIHGIYLIAKSKNYIYILLLFLVINYMSLKYENVASPTLIYPFIIYAIFISLKYFYEKFTK